MGGTPLMRLAQSDPFKSRIYTGPEWLYPCIFVSSKSVTPLKFETLTPRPTIMKRTNILYWIFTGLFALIMFSTAVPNVMMSAGSIDLITTKLGYPKYFIMITGVAKILGVIGIIVPGYPRIKEWAYAGLFFDLIAATVSGIVVEGFHPMQLFMAIFFAPGVLSYIYYHKKLRELDVKGQN